MSDQLGRPLVLRCYRLRHPLNQPRRRSRSGDRPFEPRREVAFAEDRGDGEFGALEWRRYDRCAHRRSSSAVLPLIPSSSRCSGRRSINSSITSKAPDLACSPNHVKIISGNIGATRNSRADGLCLNRLRGSRAGNSSSDLDLRHSSGVIIFSTVYANAMGFTSRRPADWLGWMCPSEPLTGRHGYLRRPTSG